MKRKVFATIYKKEFKNPAQLIKLSDIPQSTLPTDIIDIVRDTEGFYSENNSYDPSCVLFVYREREETDEEYNERKLEESELKEKFRHGRYEQYLRLKNEFESIPDIELKTVEINIPLRKAKVNPEFTNVNLSSIDFDSEISNGDDFIKTERE